MKKYKVNIPKEYKVENEYECLDQEGKKRIIIELKHIEKELPKTWDEYFRENGNNLFGGNVFIPKQYNEAITALVKLLELRDHYNDGWVPDWENDSSKFIIFKEFVHIVTACITIGSAVLAFKSEKLRDEFLTNFKDNLIETARPLL